MMKTYSEILAGSEERSLDRMIAIAKRHREHREAQLERTRQFLDIENRKTQDVALRCMNATLLFAAGDAESLEDKENLLEAVLVGLAKGDQSPSN